MNRFTAVIVIVLALLVPVRPVATTTAGGWLKGDCRQDDMHAFLEGVHVEFDVIAINVDRAQDDDLDAIFNTMGNITHAGHTIDEMTKPDCYDATQVVNVSYWTISAMLELFFFNAGGGITLAASDELDRGSAALNMICDEYSYPRIFD